MSMSLRNHQESIQRFDDGPGLPNSYMICVSPPAGTNVRPLGCVKDPRREHGARLRGGEFLKGFLEVVDFPESSEMVRTVTEHA